MLRLIGFFWVRHRLLYKELLGSLLALCKLDYELHSFLDTALSFLDSPLLLLLILILEI